MHTKFEATFKHGSSATATEAKPASAHQTPLTNRLGPGATETKFLGLDQCLPNRDYLEIIDYPAPLSNDPLKLTFDAEWLGIVRATHQYLSRTKRQKWLPQEHVLRPLIEKNIRWVKENVGASKDITEVQAFAATSPGPDPAFTGHKFPQ
ncbi:hypothetical protein FRC01_008635, partial [Tulasnella sp. 417]